MKSSLILRVDQLIEQFIAEHRGQKPLYVVVSGDEAKELREHTRSAGNFPEDYIITSYRDLKIVHHPALLNGNSYVSDALPETSS